MGTKSEELSTHNRVVELLNQASLEEKAEDKVEKLKLVEELIIHKEPSLLDNFFEEVLAFQSDPSIPVKKHMVHFLELSSTKDVNLLPVIISKVRMMFACENVNILKKLLLSSAEVFKNTFKWISEEKTVGSGRMKQAWLELMSIHSLITHLIDADNDGLRTHTIKYLETLIITLSFPPSPKNNDVINLSLLSDCHWLLKTEELEKEGLSCFQQLINYMGSLHISSINLITTMGCMTNIVKLRPHFTQQVLQGFESLHVNLPPTLTKSQVNSVRKHLRNQLLALIKEPNCTEFYSNMAVLLTDLGVSQSEVSRHRKKRGRSSGNQVLSRVKMGKKDVESDEEKVREVKGLREADEMEEEEVKVQKSAIDITADDILPRLTLESVVDMVMYNMHKLPDEMPPSFQATYTPISEAGTPSQVQHLARLLAVMLHNVGLGKGAEKKPEENRKVTSVQALQSMISTEDKWKSPVSQDKVVRRGSFQVKVEEMSVQECESLSLSRMRNQLDALQRGEVGEESWRHLTSLTLNAKQQQLLVDYVLEDLKGRSNMGQHWVYQLYLTSSLHIYEECVCMLLKGVLKMPDQKAGLFNKLLLEAPKLTSPILDLLINYCLNEEHIYLGIMTLKQLILRNPYDSKDITNILLKFTTHPNNQVRQNALRVVKSLHWLESVEEYAMQSVRYLLQPTPPPHLFPATDDDEDDVNLTWNEDVTRNCLSLCMQLLPLKQHLIHQLAEVYTESSADVKRAILRSVEVPVKSMGMNNSELLSLVENCPKGAETLVTRIIHVVTDRAVPSVELVKRVRELYEKRVSDVRFLIPVINGLEKEEVIEALPRLIKLSPVVVKEVFNRLLGLHGQTGDQSPLSAPELMVALHQLDSSLVDIKSVIKACNLCFAEKSIFTQEVLAEVIKTLVDLMPLPTLTMRTVIQSLATYPKMASFVMVIMSCLISKQVWKHRKVWEGFVKCCQRIKPQSFSLLLQLPPPQLKDAFSICPDLQEPLLSHVVSFPAHQRAHVHKSIMSVLESLPEKSVFSETLTEAKAPLPMETNNENDS